jgi:hypothetical protein
MVLEMNIEFPKVCGVLVEPRRMSNVHLLIDNFQKVTGERKLFFFCGKSHYDYYVGYYKGDDSVRLINLGVDNLDAKSHNDLWKSMEFWDNFTGFTHVLTIQTDGCLCENSEYKIEDFFKYDFVGGYTPNKWWWKETQGLHKYSEYQCFNGGFSFRRISAMQEVLKRFPPLPTEDFRENLSFRAYGEDLYFVVGLLTMNSTDEGCHYKVGLDELATKFCTHTHYLHKTFCVHKLDNYVGRTQVVKFLEYCPLFIHFTAKGSI